MNCLSLIPSLLLAPFLAATEGLSDQERENLCAQIRQESVWQPEAVSFAGASGLGQFMPPTGREEFPQVGCDWETQKFDPACQLRAQRHYMQKLMRSRICQGDDPQERWAVGFACYNGGAGWRRKERRLCAGPLHPDCDPRYWTDNQEEICLRSASACHETRTYIERIFSYGAREPDQGF